MSTVTSKQLLLIHEARVQLRQRIAECIGLTWDGRFGHDDDVWHEQQSLVQSIAIQQDPTIAAYIMALRVNYADHKKRILHNVITGKLQINVTAERRANPLPVASTPKPPITTTTTNPTPVLSESGGQSSVSPGTSSNVSLPKSRVMDILGQIPTD